MNRIKQVCHLPLLSRRVTVFLVLYLSAAFAVAQVSRSFGQIPVGNSDTNGFARLDKGFYDISLGNGRSAELFFKFSSDPRLEPKYMGVYWSIPFFVLAICFSVTIPVLNVTYGSRRARPLKQSTQKVEWFKGLRDIMKLKNASGATRLLSIFSLNQIAGGIMVTIIPLSIRNTPKAIFSDSILVWWLPA